MFENISYFFKRIVKPEQKELGSKDAAKERLHLVLMQDRANVSADFLELMKQEIIDVIKKYIVVDEKSIDVRLTNKSNDDGTTGAPALYANIPIVNIKNDMMAEKEKKFEGIDFNKEMGITKELEEENEDKIEEIVEPLEIEPIPGQEIEENKTTIIENYNEEIVEENILDYDENSEETDEEDDDDVTFDDLLKAAEEEDKAKKENNTTDVQIEDNDLEDEIIEDNFNNDNNEEENEEVVSEKQEEKKSRGRKRKNS